MKERFDEGELDVAIIGMAGRFPGSDSIAAFWKNLQDGVESITRFSHDEMRGFGVNQVELERPEFVAAAPILTDASCFDAAFFGFSPREAALMDPQHRVFLECAWKALESAGYAPQQCPVVTGVYAGTSLSSYLLYNVLPSLADPHAEEAMQAMIGNDKDFISTRVSYKLNLTGPSIDIQTGCSTSLVAVHLAAQALLSCQCDLALAGGVSIHVPQRRGYIYQKGGISSPDGHCRAFDASAEGTIFGSGVGIVVLKRLADAITDRNHIHSILKASAINNDGAAKVGFTAPSIRGQSEVIRLAQAYSGVSGDSIEYVECHGTGTPLGDPAEIAALTKAFRATTQRRNFCGIGSVKSNIGHLDAAAGIASLIKTSLAVEHGLIPPSLHCVAPHPDLALEESPFYVVNKLSKWESTRGPRRAGVSSFGIGGTNAHVILEQSPDQSSSISRHQIHILTLSAKSHSSLTELTREMLTFLESNPKSNLADIAFTTQSSRSQLAYRNAIVCGSAEEAIRAIRNEEKGRFFTGYLSQPSYRVIFLFPGGGSQHVHMAEGLYEGDAVFRLKLDALLNRAEKLIGVDLRASLYPVDSRVEPTNRMQDPVIGLVTLFLIEYALAEYWMHWGIIPEACIGHSLGEYVASAIAGVLTFDAALSLVIARSRLLSRLSAGAMLSIPLPVEEVQEMLGSNLSVAAVNGPSQTVVSGAADAIEAFQSMLLDLEIETRLLQIAVSSHSHLVEPLLDEFRQLTSALKPQSPKIPCVSNVTGNWLTDKEAMDPEYWVRHLRQPVLFGKGVGQFIADPKAIMLEVGPGNALTTLLRTQFKSTCLARPIASLRHPYEQVSDQVTMMGAMAQMWAAGATPIWDRFYEKEERRRVPLPTYPFERKLHWLPAGETASRSNGSLRLLPYSRWFYRPAWRGGTVLRIDSQPEDRERQFVIIGGPSPLRHLLREKLLSNGHPVFCVEPGVAFESVGEQQYRVGRASVGDYLHLSEVLLDETTTSWSVINLGSVDVSSTLSVGRTLGPSAYLDEVLAQFKAFGESARQRGLEIVIVSAGALQLKDTDEVCLDGALLLGLTIIASQEFPRLNVRLVDIQPEESVEYGWEVMADAIASQLQTSDPQPLSAIRVRRGWVPVYEPIRLTEGTADTKIHPAGCYLITGGLGSLGLEIARFLVKSKTARLVLVSRSGLPERAAWGRLLESDPPDSMRTRRMKAIEEMEALGGEILLISADVADAVQMERAFRVAEERFGHVNGVFHLAGTTGPDAMQLAADATLEDVATQIRAKALGAVSLKEVCEHRNLDFVFLFSSSAAYLGGTGLMAYAGANAFLDSIARKNETAEGTRWISANWDAWLPSDPAANTTLPKELRDFGITVEQGCRAAVNIAESGLRGQILVSRADPEVRIRQGVAAVQRSSDVSVESEQSHREANVLYLPPSNEAEVVVAKLWEELLGLKRLSVHENFFDLGGTSLIALRLISRIKKEMKLDVPIISIFERPTVATFAGFIAQLADPNKAAPTVPGP